MACEECERLQNAGKRNRELRKQVNQIHAYVDEVFLTLCQEAPPYEIDRDYGDENDFSVSD